MSVVIETTLGDLTIDLYLSERPRACLNFLKLCKIKYYNFNLFHTISRGFIAQTGDPTGSGNGGESLYGILDGPEKRYFEGENEPRLKHTKMGLISFVGNDDHLIGSQFFITLGEDLTYLDQKHCVFGEVVEGLDILEDINEVICDNDDRPYQDVRITHIVILDDPYPDPRRLVVPSRSPSPSAKRLQGGRIAPDEEVDETEGKTTEEVVELQAEREAKARATILEMVGDLPDADTAPPENVLFVCKLNPVTTDDDLEIIFNRFGKIVSCEVIRDRKSGDSLQYAFIEFADRKACEDAYFKMDNILIDDRRIHVDFSQSVSKVRWLGKGRGVAHFDENGQKTMNAHNDIGKGNYKIDRRERSHSGTGRKNGQDKSKRHNDSRTRAYSPRPRSKFTRHRDEGGNSPSPQRDSHRDNKSRNRDRYDSRRRENYRNRTPNDEGRSNSLTKRFNYNRGSRNRDWTENRRFEESNSSSRRRKRSVSRSPDRRTDRSRNSNSSRYYKNGSSSSKDYKLNQYRSHDDYKKRTTDTKRNANNKSFQQIDTKSDIQRKKVRSDSESSDSELEKLKKRKHSKSNVRSDKKVKKVYKKKKEESSESESESSSAETKKRHKKRKKKRKESSESDSDSSSESSDSETEKIKNRKKRTSKKSSKKNPKRKRKGSSESESSDTSDSSESSDMSESGSSSESEKDKKKKKSKRRKVKIKDSSDSDSSVSSSTKIKKKKKQKG